MAALTGLEPVAAVAKPPARPRVWRGVVFLLAAAYFLIPLGASFWYTVHTPVEGVSLSAYGELLTAEGFVRSLLLSLGLAVATIVLVLLLSLPAMLAVRLFAPRLRPVMEMLCTLPLVVPPITFVAGIGTSLRVGTDVLAPTPFWRTIIAVQDPGFPVVLVLAYVVLVLPFVYRSLDSGLRTMDVRTLVEAARNLGASWPYVVFRVVVPNLRSALASASFLTLALVLGEYTVASLLGYEPFAVWIVTVSGSAGQLSVAVSILSLLLIWLLLLAVSTVFGREKQK
ncbi:putative spermidine/putrescine transport system permease protein [Nonomuraea polychroma]|uniref:Putative spermidine/putrescine transport system permease protein n=1 Tax=Nonomuraea polychroma TaxID=46176 RepID=A0A438MD67_9ACTN|nr:ABC transporter permease subunit [Nonomuraea polychroma]RVX43686.1 putative spermidine/putrescine transport system permease protein [Nonomuraea polychroma]